jgi:hypothetical protein
MRTSALQEFLRSLGGPLGAVGVTPKSVADLRAVAGALDPFKDLDLEQLADFLRRADEYRRSGSVLAVADAPGVGEIRTTARQIGEALLALPAAEPAATRDLEGQVNRAKKDLQAAIERLSESFGSKVKFTDDKKWLPGLRERAQVRRAVEGFRHLASRISSAESYQDPDVQAEIDQLAAVGDKPLKAAAQELGSTGNGKGRKFVESVLANLTGVRPEAAKPARKGKPAADPARVSQMTRTLHEMAERAKDPNAVPDSEVEAVIARLKAEFSAAELKAMAADVAGVNVRGGGEALREIRGKLTEMKRILESQKV